MQAKLKTWRLILDGISRHLIKRWWNWRQNNFCPFAGACSNCVSLRAGFTLDHQTNYHQPDLHNFGLREETEAPGENPHVRKKKGPGMESNPQPPHCSENHSATVLLSGSRRQNILREKAGSLACVLERRAACVGERVHRVASWASTRSRPGQTGTKPTTESSRRWTGHAVRPPIGRHHLPPISALCRAVAMGTVAHVAGSRQGNSSSPRLLTHFRSAMPRYRWCENSRVRSCGEREGGRERVESGGRGMWKGRQPGDYSDDSTLKKKSLPPRTLFPSIIEM